MTVRFNANMILEKRKKRPHIKGQHSRQRTRKRGTHAGRGSGEAERTQGVTAAENGLEGGIAGTHRSASDRPVQSAGRRTARPPPNLS